MTKEEAIKYLQQLYPNGGHCWLDEQRIEAIGMAVNALQEEPKSKCQGCNNVKGCIICVGGSEWAHIEECVSIDFEQELYKAFGQVKDFTLGMRIAKWFYDMGKNSQEPVSEKLEEAAKKHSMASLEGHVVDDWVVEDFKAGANWQKKQVIEKAVEFFENDLCCYIKAQCFTIEHGRLENDFRKHIEED